MFVTEREMIKKAISKDMPDFDKVCDVCKYSNNTKNIFRISRVAIAMISILFTIFGIGTAYAISHLLGVGEVTKENIKQINNNGTTSVEENSSKIQNIDEITWEQMCVNSLQPLILSFKNRTYLMENIYIEAAYGIQLLKKSNNGFFLEKGEVLNCKVKLDIVNMGENATSVGVEFGYILDNEYVTVEDMKGNEFSFQIKADKTGEYFPCLINRSSRNLIIENGIVW